MPRRSKYPKWFSPYSKPYLPSKPQPPAKEVESLVTVKTWTVYCEDPLPLSEINSIGADKVQISYAEGPPYELVAYKTTKTPNPNYETLLGYYKTSLESWKIGIVEARQKRKEWEELHTKWKAEEAAERQARELKTLNELRKKYPNN